MNASRDCDKPRTSSESVAMLETSKLQILNDTCEQRHIPEPCWVLLKMTSVLNIYLLSFYIASNVNMACVCDTNSYRVIFGDFFFVSR